MTKAVRQMKENLSLVDMLIEITDARIPVSSRNPDIDQLRKGKLSLIVLNKSDLADPERTREWAAFFENSGSTVVLVDSRKTGDMRGVKDAIRALSREKKERDLKRGIKNRPVRAMVAGIPNVGKSTFINSFAGRSVAKTGNKPGVTKGQQWIRLDKETELLDTPGILWPKFEDETVGIHLAWTGAIRDEILNLDELALGLIGFLRQNYPGALSGRYGISEDGTDLSIMEAAAAARGCIRSGNETDYHKISGILLDDFRSGRTGRITLEHVGRNLPA